jgi:hypothetical protein
MPRFADIDAGRLAALERALGLREGFLTDLEGDDDWSYIVKLHTLMEAAVSHLLVEAFEDARLDRALRSLPLGSLRSGQLAFLRALDRLGDFDMRFVRFVAEVRDSLVQHIGRVDFSIASYFAERSDSQLLQLYRAWGFAALTDDGDTSLLPILHRHPKLLMHVRAIYLLELAYLGRSLEEAHSVSAKQLAELANSTG